MRDERVEGLGRLARELGDAADEATRLDVAVRTAVDLIDGCDHAGITVHAKGTALTPTATDTIVRQANDLQYELGEGPCLDTLRDAETLESVDLSTDERWPVWAPRVHRDLGVGSMVSLLLYTTDGAYGALSLYGDKGHAFDDGDLALAAALAGHLSVSMAAGREIDHRGRAIASRTLIGQAVGILMERYQLDPDRAFEVLRRVSMESNRKLVSVADDLVQTGKLPA